MGTHYTRRLARAVPALAGAVAAAAALAACGGGGSSSTAKSGTPAAVKAPSGLMNGGSITYGTDFTEPPYENVVGGKQVGFDVDFGKLLAGQMGLEPKFVDNRFATLIPALQAHKFDVILSAMYITGERLKQVGFVPYINTGDVLVVKKGSSYRPQAPEEMCGHKFSINSGAAVQSIASGPLNDQCKKSGKPPIKIELFPSDLASLQQIAGGRADVTLVDPALLKSLEQANPDLGLEVSSPPGKLFYPVAVGIAVRPGDAQIKTAITSAVQKLEANGKLPALRKRYAISPPDPALVKKAEADAAG